MLESLTTRKKRDVHQLDCALFRCLTAPIVPRGGGRIFVSGQPLDGRDVGTCVEQATDKRSPHIVRRERCYSCLGCPRCADHGNCLISQATHDQTAALGDTVE
jgi:hypothetical protein